MEKYKVKLLSFEEAYKIWETSPNASVYTNPNFLKNYNKIIFLAALKGDEVMCCWPIFKNKKKILIPNFFYYFGPYWAKKVSELPKHSWLSTSNNIYSKFINYLSKNFKSFSFQLHYSLLDVRIFDWWNLISTKERKFKIKPKYSAIINLDKISPKEVASNYRYVRRYEIKNFIKKGNETNIEECEYNFKEISKIYLMNNTIKLKKKQRNELLTDMKNICNLAKKFGKVRCYKEKKTNKIIYFNVVLFDKDSVHLVLNSCENNWRKKGIMAWGTNNLINDYVGKFKYFDFNGANSPLRGDDKHSYGASEKLYFQLDY